MRRLNLLLILVLILFSLTTFAQEQTPEKPGTLLFERGRFIQDGKMLSLKQALEVTKTNPAAYQEIKAAKSNSDLATIFGAAGGFFIGWPLGTAVGGGDPNWALLGVGAGLVAIAIPFAVSSKKHAIKGTEIYNSGIASVSKPDIRILFASNAAGLRITF